MVINELPALGLRKTLLDEDVWERETRVAQRGKPQCY